MTKQQSDAYVDKQVHILIVLKRIQRNAKRIAELGSCLAATRTKGDILYRDFKWAETLKNRIKQRERMKELLVEHLMTIGI